MTVGERFNDGRYTALYKLGQGHYATVWMVLDSRTGQEVAMKVRLGMCTCVSSFCCGLSLDNNKHGECHKLLMALRMCGGAVMRPHECNQACMWVQPC